jgi:hypothetical protein
MALLKKDPEKAEAKTAARAEAELHRARHPGHHHAAVLQGLPEPLHGVAAELVQVVEEQDAVVPKCSWMFLERAHDDGYLHQVVG